MQETMPKAAEGAAREKEKEDAGPSGKRKREKSVECAPRIVVCQQKRGQRRRKANGRSDPAQEYRVISVVKRPLQQKICLNSSGSEREGLSNQRGGGEMKKWAA